MKEEQKVYIKGDPNRGAEVIKALTDLGAINLNNLDGKHEKAYYYISPLRFIIEVANYEEDMMSILKEFYKEIKLPKWKPKNEECYYFIDDRGTIITSMWNKYGERKDNLRYELGNVFKTHKEAELVRDKIKKLLNQ